MTRDRVSEQDRLIASALICPGTVDLGLYNELSGRIVREDVGFLCSLLRRAGMDMGRRPVKCMCEGQANDREWRAMANRPIPILCFSSSFYSEVLNPLVVLGGNTEREPIRLTPGKGVDRPGLPPLNSSKN